MRLDGKQSEQGGIAPLIQRYLEIALYLMVVAGFVTLASTGQLDLPILLVVSAAVLYRGYLLSTKRMFLLSTSWTNILTLAFTLFFLADLFVLSGSFVTATMHFVLLLMIMRLLSAKRNRDYVFLAVLAFLMVLGAAVLTVNSTFLFMFALFMLAAVATFILMEMRRAWEDANIHAREVTTAVQRKMSLSLVSAAPALVLLILMGATVVFFILPRLSAGYLSAYAKSGELAAGFSNRVELGRIGQIQQSNAIVMHIQIAGDTKGAYDLKWRGVTLSMFDGRIWSNPLEQRPVLRTERNRFSLAKSRSPWSGLRDETQLQGSSVIRYRVLMEPVASNVFFLAPEAQMLEGNYALVTMDRGGAVYNLDAEHPIGAYQAESILPASIAQQPRIEPVPVPSGVAALYLQLPPLDPRIPELTKRITAGATSQYEQAAAIEHFLATSFGYTLQLGNTLAKDPIAYFLFERRKGHCEYFASSMAVMLRSIGIPSRVVNGFRTGEFNDVTGQYVVRARNAHSWVEAYFPASGWVSFDPTPGAGLESRLGWSRAMLYLDALQSFWREWIINYDFVHQRQLGQEANQAGRQLVENTRAWSRRHYDSLLVYARRIRSRVAQAPWRWSLVVIATAFVLFLVSKARNILALVRFRHIASHPEKEPTTAASIWYSRMTRVVARRGWRKSPAQTPAEFASIIGHPELRSQVEEFTLTYERARFGTSVEDAQRLPELYEHISKPRANVRAHNRTSPSRN